MLHPTVIWYYLVSCLHLSEACTEFGVSHSVVICLEEETGIEHHGEKVLSFTLWVTVGLDKSEVELFERGSIKSQVLVNP